MTARERDEALSMGNLDEDLRNLQLDVAVAQMSRLEKENKELKSQNEELRSQNEELISHIESANRRAESERERAESERERREETERSLKDALEKLTLETAMGESARTELDRETEERLYAEAALRKQRYTNYNRGDVMKATNGLRDSHKFGNDVDGIVYKGEVAIKVMDSQRIRQQEFETKVELLSTLHHPHIVTLLGVCWEPPCIVYDSMPNGNLEDRMVCKDGTPPLPWYIRFKICAEVAVALLFLHSRPEPIVHGDLKAGNILLDRNFVSKISDVGIAKLAPNVAVLMGTPSYIDPDYQVSDIVSCESDVYALGIIMLQLLTGKPALRVSQLVMHAIENDYFKDMLDTSAGDWPIDEATDLALLALECCDRSRWNRPNLETRILPTLETLRSLAAQAQLAAMPSPSHSSEIMVPAFFHCPISKEIMEDPHIAADGHTYDKEFISHWLRNNDNSPMTNLKLTHKNLTPNLTLRSAIRNWLDMRNRNEN